MDRVNDSRALGYKGIIGWQRGMDLVESIYQFTRMLPDSERYGLTSQMQRSAVSIPANIAEGYGRRGNLEFARFLDIAYGSLCELETLLLLAQRLGYGDADKLPALHERAAEVRRLIAALRRKAREQRP